MTTILNGQQVEAAPQDEEATLPTVVVSATRSENPLHKVPASVGVVDLEQFNEQQAQSVSEVLEDLPGIYFGGGPRPAGQIPTIRGENGRRITLIVDGARRNEGGTVLSPLVLDPDLLSGVEVVRGASSSLYGSGGMGGVMVFRSLSADDLLEEGETFGSQVKAGAATADSSHNYHARIYGRKDGIDSLLALSYRDWDEIEQGGDTKLSPNDGEVVSGLAKVGWQVSDRVRLQLSHQIYDEENYRPTNPQADSSFPYLQQTYTKQEETVFKADTVNDAGEKALSMTLYRTMLDRDGDQNLSSPQPVNATSTDTETVGGTVQYTSRLGEGIRHRLTYGVDYYKDKQSATDGGSPNPVIPDGSQAVTGVFLQDEIDLSDRWRLVPSLRHDGYDTSMSDGSNPDKEESRVSPKLSLLWQATKATSVYVSYGEAFRAPSVSEMYQNLSGDTFFTNFAANPDLKPEVSTTVELGFRGAYKGVASASDRLEISGALYQAKSDDLIENRVIGTYTHPFIGTRPILQAQNVSEAKREGFEIEAGYSIGTWNVTLAYSRVRITDEQSGDNLFSPPDETVAQVRHWFGAEQSFSVLWSGRWIADQDYDSTVERRRNGYKVHDLFLTWLPSPKWRVDLGVTNIFDEAYAPYQSSNSFAVVNEEGRSVKASVSANI